MWTKLRIWIANRYQTVVNSIAFYPALIALLFLFLSFLFIGLDFSDTGKQIKSQLHWLSLKDASTARSIISAIVSGIISLAVFSFSMVMIVLNQTASQMSNRILDNLIGNRFQQIVLGIYIGTIVFALFLLSTIRDIDSGIYVPALSTYLLIVLTIIDIFLFIYFLHYITQSVKYEVIIKRIFKQTKLKMENYCHSGDQLPNDLITENLYPLYTNSAGVYEGFNKQTLLRICNDNDCTIHFLKVPGTFLYKNTPIVKASKSLSPDIANEIIDTLYVNDAESIDNNFFYGFRQLMEVAIKALSPGINDPGTAVECLRALSELFLHRIKYAPCNTIKNKNNLVVIITKEITPEEIFAICFLPIWDYGKNDRMIQNEFLQMLTHFRSITNFSLLNKLFEEVNIVSKKNAV